VNVRELPVVPCELAPSNVKVIVSAWAGPTAASEVVTNAATTAFQVDARISVAPLATHSQPKLATFARELDST
jgi:hypothetical protein